MRIMYWPAIAPTKTLGVSIIVALVPYSSPSEPRANCIKTRKERKYANRNQDSHYRSFSPPMADEPPAAAAGTVEGLAATDS